MATGAELLDLCDRTMRKEGVRFDILDRNLELLFEVHPVWGTCRVSLNTGDRTARTLSGFQLPPGEAQLIDTDAHRVRPTWVLEGTTDEYPLGVFLFSDRNSNYSTRGRDLAGTLGDQSVILDQGRDSTFSIVAGGSLQTAMETIAGEVAIPAVSIDVTSAVASAPIAWPAGTTRLEILTTLCNLAGFYSPYFDNEGTLICRAVPLPLTSATADHTYNEDDCQRIVADSISESEDLLSAPNRYLVICNSATTGEIIGSYEIPASAPHSVSNRGFEVVKIVREQGLESTAAANARAEVLAAEDPDSFVWVQFDAVADPRHDAHAIVEYLFEPHREVGWDLALKPGGPMTHKLRKIY